MRKGSRLDGMDILLYGAMPYVENRELAEYESVGHENLVLPDRARRRILRRVRRMGKYFERHAEYNPVLEGLQRVAVVILVVMSLCFAGTMSIDAVRATLWETIVEWFEDSIFFQFVVDDETVQEVINEYKEPKLSDKYKRKEIRKNRTSFYVEYISGEKVIMYTQSLLSDNDILLSNHDTIFQEVIINQYEGKMTEFQSKDTKALTFIWNDGIYMYKIEGNLELEELLIIAESVS